MPRRDCQNQSTTASAVNERRLIETIRISRIRAGLFLSLLVAFQSIHSGSGFVPSTASSSAVPLSVHSTSWRKGNTYYDSKQNSCGTPYIAPSLDSLEASRNIAFASLPGEGANSSSLEVGREDDIFAPSSPESAHPPQDVITKKDKIAMLTLLATSTLGFTGLVLLSGPGTWRYFLAGGVCAAVSHSVPVPIDVVKTRKQVDPALENKDFLEATNEIIQKEGVQTLFSGLGPTVWGYLLEGSIKFGVYEMLKPVVRGILRALSITLSLNFLGSQMFSFIVCATISGLAASIILCPMEALRIRMVTEPQFAPSGWIEGGLRMLKNEGIRGLWKGATPMAWKQIPYTTTKNVSFDIITKNAYAFLRRQGQGLSSTTMFVVPLVSAAIASVLACVSSQPGDMLLSLVNAHEDDDRRTLDFSKDILRTRGIRGFFVGMQARIYHVGIIVTMQLLIYDFVKRLCGIAATGSV